MASTSTSFVSKDSFFGSSLTSSVSLWCPFFSVYLIRYVGDPSFPVIEYPRFCFCILHKPFSSSHRISTLSPISIFACERRVVETLIDISSVFVPFFIFCVITISPPPLGDELWLCLNWLLNPIL